MKILLVEDERDMSRVVSAVLRHEGYDVDVAPDGVVAVELVNKESYDCIVMDVMMPRKDGITALREIRASGDMTPIIMLTAKAEIEDRIQGLDSGADDYITKPFSIKELLARIRSQTRRKSSFIPTKLSLGNTTLDVEEQELSSQNSIRLNHKETKLLTYFIMHAGKVLDEDTIFKHFWADEPEVGFEVVWVYVSYLRQKLASFNSNICIEGNKGESFVVCVK